MYISKRKFVWQLKISIKNLNQKNENTNAKKKNVAAVQIGFKKRICLSFGDGWAWKLTQMSEVCLEETHQPKLQPQNEMSAGFDAIPYGNMQDFDKYWQDQPNRVGTVAVSQSAKTWQSFFISSWRLCGQRDTSIQII